MSGDASAFFRIHFLYAALKSGVLRSLESPSTLDEITERLHIQRPELLRDLLELGVTLSELSRQGSHYKVTGHSARVVMAEDAMQAMLEEYVSYHAAVYRRMPEYLGGAPPDDYLGPNATVIARSSRLVEPFMANFARTLVRPTRPMRLLEIGCGSGIYLRHAAQANPQLTGVGIDQNQAVVAQASANLQAWGIRERFELLQADARNLPPELDSFDLITLYNNIYYFSPDERPQLFFNLRSRLNRPGTLALVSQFQGSTLTALDFNLILRATQGCFPLPKLKELMGQLEACDFRVKANKLAPGEPFYGIAATVK